MAIQLKSTFIIHTNSACLLQNVTIVNRLWHESYGIYSVGLDPFRLFAVLDFKMKMHVV